MVLARLLQARAGENTKYTSCKEIQVLYSISKFRLIYCDLNSKTNLTVTYQNQENLLSCLKTDKMQRTSIHEVDTEICLS